MAQAVQLVRNPPPRLLGLQETLYSLNHWRTTFRTYYRRDSYYKGFLLPNATWDPNHIHYGQDPDMTDETVLRSTEDKCEDLKDFLNTLIGYLPFLYLTEKVLRGTTNLQQVWDLIFEHYGLKVSSESLLDFTQISLQEGESFRQFFDRLMSHSRLHLTGANITVDGINSGPNGETMTISLMNFVALTWLQKINPTLVDIVKVEYGKELRDGQPLAALVPRIAVNVEALLTKSNVAGNVSKVDD